VHPGSTADLASKPKVAPAAAAQAPANTISKQASTETKKSVAAKTAESSQTAKAPASGQVPLAAPTRAAKEDPSDVDRALLGRTYRQSITVDGFNVPLPPGQWAVLANGDARPQGAAGVAYFLGHIEHKRLVGAIRLFAAHSNEQPGAGFSAANGCTSGNPNVNHLVIEEVTPHGHQACWLINNFFTPPMQRWKDPAVKIDGLDRAAARHLAAMGVSYPQDLVFARFTRAETWGLLEVSYLFDPELNGIDSDTALSARDSNWHAPNVGVFPDKVAYLAKIRNWGDGFWPKFKLAFASGTPPSLRAEP
jgi:hypothetical protein